MHADPHPVDVAHSDPAVEVTLGAADAPAWTRRPAGLSNAVAQELVRRIVTGAYRPGEPLPTEPLLCATFSVSRTVVREAVKMLREKRLVLVRQGSGTVITAPETWNLLDEQVLGATIDNDRESGILDDVVVTRRLLESDMAFVAARTAAEDVVDHLRDLVDRMDGVVASWPEYMPLDKQFHDVIMRASGNRIARGVVRALELQATQTARYVGNPDPMGCVASNRGHREILDRIAGGDPAGASAAMNRHITEAWIARSPGLADAGRLDRA